MPNAASFMSPQFVVSDAGILAVTTDHHVVNYGLDGSFLGNWGQLATDDITPIGAVGDAAGDVYVVDVAWSHDRVLKFDTAGHHP